MNDIHRYTILTKVLTHLGMMSSNFSKSFNQIFSKLLPTFETHSAEFINCSLDIGLEPPPPILREHILSVATALINTVQTGGLYGDYGYIIPVL